MPAHRRHGLVAAAAAMLLALATAACGGRSQAAPAAMRSPTTTEAPAAGRDPGPAGERRDAEGATAAALAYLRLAEAVVTLAGAEAAAIQRSVSSEAAADALADQLVSRLAALRRAFPSGLAYRVAPLGVHVAAIDAGRAVVEVWYVGVVVSPDATPYEEWRTARTELVWERNAWRVAAESATHGPRPASLAQPAPASAAALGAAFERFRVVG